jgi:hypothetical protein
VKRSGADTVPGFGLAELSLNRETFELDRDKLESFERKVTYSLQVPASRLENPPRFKEQQDNEPVDVEMMRPWLPMFQLLYACMLKILALSRGGLARERALSNVRSFVEWMCSDLNVFTALPLQAAYAVFGGDGKARKLVGVDSRRDPISCAWGAAWDVYYIMSLFHIKLNPIDATPERYIFVTRDAACYEVFSRCRLFGGLRPNDDHTLPLTGIDSDYPHFASRTDELAKIIRPFAMSRIPKLVDSSPREHSHFARLIAALEAELGEGDSLPVPAGM